MEVAADSLDLGGYPPKELRQSHISVFWKFAASLLTNVLLNVIYFESTSECNLQINHQRGLLEIIHILKHFVHVL